MVSFVNCQGKVKFWSKMVIGHLEQNYMLYLIPLYRAASEKVRNSKIQIKRLLAPMHFFLG